MTNAAKFLFNTDFRQPAAAPVKDTAAIDEAEARGYMRGLADGQRQGEVEAQLRVAGALEHLAGQMATILDTVEAHRSETEALATEFAMALARKLAGDALAREPLQSIADAAAQTFQHLRGVPHLVVRVNETLVEPVEALIKRMARERGFEGRLVILGEPDIGPGDVQLEWADGGVLHSRSRIEDAVARTLGHR